MQPNTPSIGVELTIGADPELFLTKDGELKSSIGLIGGSKLEPRALGNRAGFYVQEDNVAVEFNIPPAKSLQEFCDAIEWGVRTIDEEVKPFGMQVAFLASAIFPDAELATPQAQMFGCTPDFNAWKRGKRNPRPRARNTRLRSCGGHIHVGYPLSANIDKHRAVQMMDLYLGVPSVMMDTDQQRRKLYGKAGCYRVTDYGFEYRVLSNFWLKEPKYTEWAYTQTIRALNRATKLGRPRDDGKMDDYDKTMKYANLGDEIVKTINKGDVNRAHVLSVHHDLDVR